MADLSDYTSLRVGGPAKKFVEVSSEKEIIAAIQSAGDSPILIMGWFSQKQLVRGLTFGAVK